MQQLGDRQADRLTGRSLVVDEPGRWIDLEAEPATIGSPLEIDSGDHEIQPSRESQAGRGDLVGNLGGLELGALPLSRRVTVVHGFARDGRGKDGIADRVHAHVASGHELLQLARPVAEQAQSRALFLPEATHDGAQSADRLVDHLPAEGLDELLGRSGIRGDQRARCHQAGASDGEGLQRLAVIREAAGDAVHDETGQLVEDRHEREVALRHGSVRERLGERRESGACLGPRPAREHGADLGQVQAPVGPTQSSLRDAATPTDIDAVLLGEEAQIDEAIGEAAVGQTRADQLGHRVGDPAADEDHDAASS